VISGGAAVHEGLSHHAETRVHDQRLVDVKHKVRVLDDVHPEPQGKAEIEKHKKTMNTQYIKL
jgi:hypothetical protein